MFWPKAAAVWTFQATSNGRIPNAAYGSVSLIELGTDCDTDLIADNQSFVVPPVRVEHNCGSNSSDEELVRMEANQADLNGHVRIGAPFFVINSTMVIEFRKAVIKRRSGRLRLIVFARRM